MNTVTFDGGVKRQFALPVAIVLGAHAALFLGFVGSPPALRPAPKNPVIPVCTLPLPVIEVPGPNVDQPARGGLSQPHLPDIPDPISPEQPSIPGIPIAPTLPIAHMISPGPWSPPGDLRNGVGPGEQTYSPESLDRSPEVVRQPQPIYPLDARIKSESGEVVVTFVVDESGRVLNPRVVSSSDPVFEEPTLRAIGQWRFARGTLHGVPVRFRMSVPVAFKLEG